MSYMMKVLTDLGVDFTKKEHTHYKFQSKGFMDLIVETWKVDEWLHVSVAHYYVQEGDLIADPEIHFRFMVLHDVNGKPRTVIQPIHYRKGVSRVYHEALIFGQRGQILLNPSLDRQIRRAMSIWARTIKNHGYTLRPMKTN